MPFPVHVHPVSTFRDKHNHFNAMCLILKTPGKSSLKLDSLSIANSGNPISGLWVDHAKENSRTLLRYFWCEGHQSMGNLHLKTRGFFRLRHLHSPVRPWYFKATSEVIQVCFFVVVVVLFICLFCILSRQDGLRVFGCELAQDSLASPQSKPFSPQQKN